jgi:uncharacterized CHY-type Zn-finger protein
MREIHQENIKGVDIDEQTRCGHYNSELDIIAIKFKCCGEWYPCIECHSAVADHAVEVWSPDEFNERAVLCGSCGHRLTVNEYLSAGSVCPKCKSGFNPGCANHYQLYFAI